MPGHALCVLCGWEDGAPGCPMVDGIGVFAPAVCLHGCVSGACAVTMVSSCVVAASMEWEGYLAKSEYVFIKGDGSIAGCVGAES